jgi:hypothetical protein
LLTKLLYATLIATIVCVIGAPRAGASFAYRVVYSSQCGCTTDGSRATILSPTLSESTLNSGDFLDSAVFGVADANNGIQTGVTYEYQAPEGPSCNLGSSSRQLYYYVETASSGVFQCFSNGSATFATGHLQSVVLNTDGYWRAYLDGNSAGIRVSWNSICGVHACEVRAEGEELANKSGHWPAKFAGSGNTQWQRWTGSTWFTIQSANEVPGSNWTFGGPFPAGIWNITYSK